MSVTSDKNNSIVKYKQMTAIQDKKTKHVMIFNKKGGLVSHAQCSKKLSMRELRKQIDEFIELRRVLF